MHRANYYGAMTPFVRVLATLVLSLAMTSLGTAASKPPITVDELLASTVTVAPGATATADEQSRLEQAAKDLAAPDSAGESFPTRFVLVPAPKAGDDLNDQANQLWASAKTKLGDPEALDAVVFLAPREIGIAANAFASEITAALGTARPTLTADRVAGAIEVMQTLKRLDAENALPDGSTTSDASETRGRATLLWISSAIIVLLGAIGVIASRRLAVKTARRLAEQDSADAARAADDGAPPVDDRQ